MRSITQGINVIMGSTTQRQGFTEITLHGYRYAWARRAKSFGMPLREAMAHLGHGSKAVHQAYSESAEIVTLPLEFYEKQHRDKILQFRPIRKAVRSLWQEEDHEVSRQDLPGTIHDST